MNINIKTSLLGKEEKDIKSLLQRKIIFVFPKNVEFQATRLGNSECYEVKPNKPVQFISVVDFSFCRETKNPNTYCFRHGSKYFIIYTDPKTSIMN